MLGDPTGSPRPGSTRTKKKVADKKGSESQRDQRHWVAGRWLPNYINLAHAKSLRVLQSACV